METATRARGRKLKNISDFHRKTNDLSRELSIVVECVNLSEMKMVRQDSISDEE